MRPVLSSSQTMMPRYDNFQYVSEDSEDNEDDDDNVLTIDLNAPVSNQSTYAAKRTTTSNFQKEPKYHQEKLDIIAATFCTSGDDVSFRVTAKAQPESSGEGNMTTTARWV